MSLSFITIEIERTVEKIIAPHIQKSEAVQAVNQAIRSDIEAFMQSRNVRPIGYACLGVMILLALAGLLLDRKGMASLGGIFCFLPTFAYFFIHMSFFAGLGILKALWQPFWGSLVKLGDIAYLPYMALVYPFSLIGIDIRRPLTHLLAQAGLAIFVLGLLAWFYTRFNKKGTTDLWVYRFSRHPQYLGWMLWSYALMLGAAQRTDIPLGDSNPGGSLPWVVSTLILVCVALGEEIRMRKMRREEYQSYRGKVPFLLPLPTFLSRVIASPLRFMLKKPYPETRWELLLTFFLYIGLVLLLSLPFVVLDWPGGGGWKDWPVFG